MPLYKHPNTYSNLKQHSDTNITYTYCQRDELSETHLGVATHIDSCARVEPDDERRERICAGASLKWGPYVHSVHMMLQSCCLTARWSNA